MYLRSLELTNFRNFRHAEIQLQDGPTVLVGDNGQGKTNLLEAIELLATARSPRTSSDRELVNWSALEPTDGLPPEPFARIRAVAVREPREVRAEVLIRADPPDGAAANHSVSKTFRVDGVAKRAMEFVGTILVVAFSPLDVALVDGSPSGRRRYLDVMNSQASRRYLYGLQRYQKLLLQRNHLLRQFRGRGPDEASLDAWTRELTSEAAHLIRERARAVHDLSDPADRWFSELRGPGGRLEIRYHPGLGRAADAADDLTDDDEAETGAIHAALAAEFERIRPREIGAGMTLVGPHRDDLRFRLDGADLTIYGSRGQQRLAAVALKLAEADLLETRSGSRPVMLMDDVLSELDPSRQRAVLEFAARGGQTLLTMTSTDVLLRRDVAPPPILEVDAGRVQPAAHWAAPA